jgi:acetyl-CoA C-acetyltransferase
MSKVAIIGVGQSTFVRSYPGAIRELVFEGFKDAMQNAQLGTSDIDASVICSAPEYDKQRSPAGVFAEYLGLNPQPTFYVETLCSSGSTGLKLAYSLVKSGLHDTVAVIGFQKMSEISSSESQERMGRGAGCRYSVGKSLWHHDACILRHVCQGPYGKIRHHLGRSGADPC